MKSYINTALGMMAVLLGVCAKAQVHPNDNLWYNNGAQVTLQNGALLTVQGDVTTNGNGVAGVTHLQNDGFLLVQGNLYGDNAFKQTGNGTLRLQNKTPLYTATYANENYQVIQGGYRVNGGQAAIGNSTDGSLFSLELDNQNGQVYVKGNTDVRGSVDFKPASITVSGITIAPNGTVNRLLTFDPGTAAAPATAPTNGTNYTSVFGMMNNIGGLGNFKNLSTNLTVNNTTADNAYIQGKLRRAINTSTGGSYGFPIGLQPSTSSTAARGIQYALLDFTANNYDVLTGYFQQGKDNTVSSPGTVCSLSGGFVYYGTVHGEWNFTPQTNAAQSYNLTIYPQDYGAASSSSYFVTKDEAVPSPGVQSCGTSPTGLSVTGIQGFSNFGFAGGAAVLPVTLVSFTAIDNNCTANLKWQTSNEQNSSFYSVEYSTDGNNFSALGKVLSKNSPNGAIYSYKYDNPIIGTSYFRIKSVDADNKSSYSPIVALTNNGACSIGYKVKISPNPTSKLVTLEGLVIGSQISIIDLNGIKLIEVTATATSQSLNLANYANGIYLVRIQVANGSVDNVKVLKQ